MNILFIGNSYTYFFDLPSLFADLCLISRWSRSPSPFVRKAPIKR